MFYGGEPTLNLPFVSNVIEMTLQLPLKETSFHIVTNGIELHRIQPAILRYLSTVWISFDGTSKTIDRVRGTGVHDVIIEQLGILRARFEKPIIARMTIGSFSQLPEDIQHACEHFDHVQFQVDNTISADELLPFAARYEHSADSLIEWWLSELSACPRRFAIDNFLALWFLMRKGLQTSYYHCSPGVDCVTIDSRGAVFSCPEGESPETHQVVNECLMGNVKDELGILRHKPKTRCLQCADMPWCGGRCIWSDHDGYCKIAKVTIRLVKERLDRIDRHFPMELGRPHWVLPGLASEIVP